jgi:PAS domain S-box-containing protein
VQRTDNAFGFLIINPVRSEVSNDLLGFTVGVFDIDQSILSLTGIRRGDNFEFEISDADPSYPDALISGSTEGDIAFVNRQFQSVNGSEVYPIYLPQREWILEVAPFGGTTPFAANVWIPMAMGVLLTIALLTYINSQIGLRQTVQRKVSEQTEALASSHQRFSFLEARTNGAIDAAEEGYLLVDHERKVIWLNPAFRAMFGLPDRKWTGTNSAELLEHAEHNLVDPEKFTDEIMEIYGSTTAVIRDQIVETSSRDNRWLSRSSVPISGSDGEYLGRLWTYRDVTKSMAAESAKSEFVSVVSHELRTPLTSIKGALSLISAGITTPGKFDTPKMLDIALRNTDRLVRLVNDILDIEKIQAGKLEPNFARTNLVDILNSSISDMFGLSQSSQVSIVSETELSHIDIYGDSDRLTQVMVNLIGNSIKYSPEGGVVTVAATIVNGSVMVTIGDEGPGIRPEDHIRIFETFHQSDSSDSRAKDGSGLGLAIAKSIVELHGGSIWVESKLGYGSEFSFTIPSNIENLTSNSDIADSDSIGLAG